LLKETAKYDFSDVLDVGLGEGEASEFFLSRGKKVTATGFKVDQYDILDSVRRYVQIHEGVDIESMEVFEDDSFDAVWYSNVLEHSKNVGRSVEEMKRVVRPGGMLFLIAPLIKTL
jgi:ubiquinone/menaquinone biosynthesis C-methylase UbiE